MHSDIETTLKHVIDSVLLDTHYRNRQINVGSQGTIIICSCGMIFAGSKEKLRALEDTYNRHRAEKAAEIREAWDNRIQ